MHALRNFLFCLLLTFSSFYFSACALQQEDAASSGGGGTGTDSTGGETIDNGETGQDIAVDDFKVSFDENTEYQVYWSKDGDNDSVVSAAEHGTECIGTSGTRTQCILDIDELDLWSHGVTINVELPGTMCAYLRQRPYYFSTAKVGEMPDRVFYSKDEDGNVTGAKFCFPSDPTCSYNAVAPNSSVGTYDPGDTPDLNRSGWITVDSEEDVKCPWDYSVFDDALPSCCVGRYTARVYDAADPTSYEDQELEWGGALKNCIQGPAVDDSFSKIDDDSIYQDFPQPHITEVVGDGYGTEYKIPAATTYHKWINLYYANFFKASDHSAGTQTCYSLEEEISDYPAACPSPTGGQVFNVETTDQLTGLGYPYYTYECLDHNEEVVSRIDVLIREWNTKSELLLGASGDPDVTGAESAPFASRDKNDYCDWKDFATATTNIDTPCRWWRYSNFESGLYFLSMKFID